MADKNAANAIIPEMMIATAERRDEKTSTSWLCGDEALFRSGFDSQVHTFRHRLSDHPLFEFSALLNLAKAMAANPDDIYYDAGDVAIGQRWADVPPTELSVAQLFERIQIAGAWIVLRRAEKFPEYTQLLDECISEIEMLSGRDIDALMQLKNAIVFINSPGRVTSYHIDRECNWLLQIAGEKTLHIFDRDDRAVIPEQEFERFWAVSNNSAVYKPEYEHRARLVTLRPGDGVHIPVGSPHWVQNGKEVSVSLSVNFHYKESIKASIYRVNYFLRRLGLQPKPPGCSPLGDWTKRRISGPIFKTRNWINRRLR